MTKPTKEVQERYNAKMGNFGPIRLKVETIAELKEAAVHRTQASIVRELVETWAEARRKQKAGAK
jgi:hypothetical protein